MAGVDAHAHVWQRPLEFIGTARYRPQYDAPVGQYVAQLDRHRLAKGLLIQPSFLGYDNSQVLAAVAKHRDRLRAVVMADPSTTSEALVELQSRGAVGLRYNLVGLPLPDFAAEPHAGLIKRIAAQGWHVEIHRDARDLHALLPPLVDAGVRVVVDHFGRPNAKDPAKDPGFRYLLTHGGSGRVWVKISGAYRVGGEAAAQALTPMLLDHFPPDRLPWGSDWPHTQHEDRVSYEATYAMLVKTVPNEAIRTACLAAANALFPG